MHKNVHKSTPVWSFLIRGLTAKSRTRLTGTRMRSFDAMTEAQIPFRSLNIGIAPELNLLKFVLSRRIVNIGL